MKLRTRLYFILVCGAVQLSCGSETNDTDSSALRPFQSDPSTAATIEGRVLFQGEVPSPAKIDMRGDPKCQESHQGSVFSEQIIVNPNQGLRNTFVWVKEGLAGFSFDIPESPVRIDQQGCLYTPRVIGLQIGQQLEWSNSDPVDHNVHPIPRENYEWNRTQRVGAAPVSLQYDKPESMILVKCNLHPWMSGFVNVVPHPFFAISDEEGSFVLRGLPPGEYLVEAVHETLGSQQVRVTLAPQATRKVDFTFTK